MSIQLTTEQICQLLALISASKKESTKKWAENLIAYFETGAAPTAEYLVQVQTEAIKVYGLLNPEWQALYDLLGKIALHPKSGANADWALSRQIWLVEGNYSRELDKNAKQVWRMLEGNLIQKHPIFSGVLATVTALVLFTAHSVQEGFLTWIVALGILVLIGVVLSIMLYDRSFPRASLIKAHHESMESMNYQSLEEGFTDPNSGEWVNLGTKAQQHGQMRLIDANDEWFHKTKKGN